MIPCNQEAIKDIIATILLIIMVAALILAIVSTGDRTK